MQAVADRFYDPATGGFLSRDPLVGLTRSAYGYAGSTPVNATDPTGEWCWFNRSWGGGKSCREQKKERAAKKAKEFQDNLASTKSALESVSLQAQAHFYEEMSWSQQAAIASEAAVAVQHVSNAEGCVRDRTAEECAKTFVNELASVGLQSLGPCGELLWAALNDLLNFVGEQFKIVNKQLEAP